MNIVYLGCAVVLGGFLMWLIISVCVAFAALDNLITTKNVADLKAWQYALALLSVAFAAGAGAVLVLAIFAASIVCVYKFIVLLL